MAYILDWLIVVVPVAIVTVAAGLGRYGDYSLDAVGAFAYATLLIGGTSAQTVGMRVMNIGVADAATCTYPIGYGRAAARTAVAVLIGIILIIGPLLDLLWPLWDSDEPDAPRQGGRDDRRPEVVRPFMRRRCLRSPSRSGR